MGAIAYVFGTAIAPGVSKNGRLYTKDMIRAAVAEAQPRLAADGDEMPLTQLTHHDAGDDSEKIVGRIVDLTYEESTGKAKYKAALPDTDAGRRILSLVDTHDGPAFLKGVSIRGTWRGQVRRVQHEGATVETADGLSLAGLDYTATPGVRGAVVDRVERVGSRPRETADGRTLIFESVVEANVITEDVAEKGAPALTSGKPAAAPTKSDGPYADPGYQDDKAKRYPLTSKVEARAAWSYINMPKNARMYTAPQLKRIKDRIRSALTKFGVKIDAKEQWLIAPAQMVTESVTEMDVWPDRPGALMVQLDNGMFTVTISSCQVDPADLEMCATAAMSGACAAYREMDPDVDGDIDGDGPDDESTDDNAMETVTPRTSPPAATPAAVPATETETGMAESTNAPAAGSPAAPAAPAAPVAQPTETVALPPTETKLSLGEIQALFTTFQQAVAGAQPAPVAAPAESAPSAPVAESAPVTPAPVVPVNESDADRIARLVAEGIQAALPSAVQEHVETHGVQRKGLVVEAAAPTVPGGADDEFPAAWPRENGIPKEAHKLTGEEWKSVRQVLPGAVLAARGAR